MTLVSRITALATAMGTDIKALFTKQGDLTTLTTVDKTNIVNAINEVKSSASGGTPHDLWNVVNARSAAVTGSVTIGSQIPGAPTGVNYTAGQYRLNSTNGDIYIVQAGGTVTLHSAFADNSERTVNVLYGTNSTTSLASGMREYKKLSDVLTTILVPAATTYNVNHTPVGGSASTPLSTIVGNLANLLTTQKTNFVDAINEAKYPFTSAKWIIADFTSSNFGSPVVIGDPIPGTNGKTFQVGTIGVSTSFAGTLGNAYSLQADGSWTMYQELLDNGYQTVVTPPLKNISGYNVYNGLIIFRREGSFREIALNVQFSSTVQTGAAVNNYASADVAIGTPLNLSTTSKQLVGSINEAIENKGVASKTDTSTTAGLVPPSLQNIVQKYAPTAAQFGSIRYTGIRKFEHDSTFSNSVSGGVVVGVDWYRQMNTGSPGNYVTVHESRINIEAATTIANVTGNQITITKTDGSITDLVGNRVTFLSNTAGNISTFTGYTIDSFTNSGGTIGNLVGFTFPDFPGLSSTVRTSFWNKDSGAPIVSAAPIIDQSFMQSSATSTGFSINVPATVQFVFIKPDAIYATGTIVFPATASLREGQMLTVTTSKDVTAITWSVSGATLTGAPSGLTANQMVVFKYITGGGNQWICINSPPPPPPPTPSGPPTQYSTYSLNKDVNGVYTVVEQKTAAGVLYARSTLTGGTSPKYTTRTTNYYGSDGTTITNTYVYTITYDGDDIVAEVLT